MQVNKGKLVTISILLALFSLTNSFQVWSQNKKISKIETSKKLFKFKCIKDENPAYTEKLAKEVFQICPPLSPERFDKRVWRLWGLKVSDYPKDSLVIIGGNGDTESLVLSPKHRLIWVKTYQTSIYGSGIPKSYPSERQAIFYQYMMMDDIKSLQSYIQKYSEPRVDENIDFMGVGYGSAIFDARKKLMEYIDKNLFAILLFSYPDHKYIMSNLRFDAVSLYVQKQLNTGRLLFPYGEDEHEKSDNKYICPDQDMIATEDDINWHYTFYSYMSSEANTYPIPSDESMAAAWISSCLKYRQEKINNMLVTDLYRKQPIDMVQEKTARFKQAMEKNNYYGYTLVREFMTNPKREMPTLEKIGKHFRATPKQSQILLSIEPFVDCYSIDTITTDEPVEVYETGHDDYYFAEIKRPVESPIAGTDGYARILDRKETIYGYVKKSEVKQLKDSDMLASAVYMDKSKAKKGRTNDPDGYTNLRKESSTSSEILKKVQQEEVFYYWEIPCDNRCVVELENGLRGFMYKDRIEEKVDAGKWIINE